MNGIPTALLLFLFERGSRVKSDIEVDSIGLEEGVATHCSILAWRTSMDRGAWWDMVQGVAKSQTRMSS